MNARCAVVASLLVACSGSAPEPPAIVEEPLAPEASAEHPAEPSATATPVATPPVAPPIEALPPMTDVEMEVFTPREDWNEIELDELEAGEVTLRDDALYELFVVPTFDVPQRDALTAAISARVAAFAAEANDPHVQGNCRSTVATRTLVSLQCRLEGAGGRTAFDSGRFALSFRLGPDGVHEAPVPSSVLPGTNLDALATVACEAEHERRIEMGAHQNFDEICVEPPLLSYGARGFVAVFTNLEHTTLEATVPYDAPELSQRLLVDGPVGGLAAIGARTRVTVAAADALALEPSNAWTYGPPVPLDVALLAFDRGEAATAELFVGEAGARAAHRVSAASAAEVTAGETASRLLAGGAPVVRVPPDRVVELARLVVTTPVNVRQQPGTDGAFVATLSIGTRVVGVRGTLDGHASERGERGSWVRVLGAEGLSGWVSGRYLDDAPASLGSRPALTAHGGVPDEAFTELAPHALLGSVGNVHFAILAARPRSWILVAASPRFAEITRTIEVEGRIEEVRWSSGRDGADVAIVGTSAIGPGEPGFDGTMRWQLVAPGASTPGWSVDARTHPALPEAERDAVVFDAHASGARFPITVTPRGGRARRARWDGTAFVER